MPPEEFIELYMQYLFEGGEYPGVGGVMLQHIFDLCSPADQYDLLCNIGVVLVDVEDFGYLGEDIVSKKREV